MSLVPKLSPALAVLFLLLTGVGDAAAQQGSSRFFFDELEEDEELDETGFDGSLTSTTIFHREASGLATPINMGDTQAENASPISRFFTDLRGQLDLDHIAGSTWDARIDLRGRLVPGSCRSIGGSPNADPCTRFQSGAFSGNEFELRELKIVRRGELNHFTFGRQFALELAATKFDGLKYERDLTAEWRLLGFGGLYPARTSRDIRDDYPVVPDQVAMQNRRALPVVVGGGGAYRYERAYGALGTVLIYPLTREVSALPVGQGGGTGTLERPRLFVTANGYWRANPKLDLYHFVVADVTSSSGAALTNLNLGVNFRPVQSFRTYLQVTQVDTETLNINAQSRLEDAGGNVDQVQNNIAVMRIASQSARLGVSAAFVQDRFEFGVTGTIRRRPEINVVTNMNNPVTFPSAQAADIHFQAVDRRSFADMRIGLGITRSFGLGGRNADRSATLVVRGDVSRAFGDGKAEVEGNLTYVGSNDETRLDQCAGAPAANNIETCFGTSATRTIGLGGTAFYRFADSWFLMGGVNLALQRISAVNGAMAAVAQPSIFLSTFFARVAYRF